ncbi:MAG: bifunctional phosphopantothenoylcysteine decarboxylase/phosphopantothenate--cysteine ligase CoaBC [Firmicutes bacterium]|nr:bifunctional phosphopantothenoylcysteine decarboxylase/phosphopantothenate--cysteine ligase CoaBC [Bacillota bacterium]
MLKGKTVVLGVCGGIAAYKIPNLARMLIKAGAEVDVIMTKNAQNFITPFTFETLTKRKCLTDTFDRNFEYSVEHVALAKKADIFVIAPATANVIGKIASGIADDMLTTTLAAYAKKTIIAPAMNHNMYHNRIVAENIEKLKRFGYEFVGPERGMLANGDEGDGRMCAEKDLYDVIVREISCEKDMAGISVLVTAGATRESIDPVRFISNRSTGKMGLAIACAAAARGADVTVVKGSTEVEFPKYMNVIDAASAEDMYRAVMTRADADIIIKAAAVADYAPARTAAEKIKKSGGDMSIELTRTKDILKALGENKRAGQLICGFSMETENLVENSRKKLTAKNADMIAANNLKTEGAGFGTDTNVITLITKDGVTELPLMSKPDAAHAILTALLTLRRPKRRPY